MGVFSSCDLSPIAHRGMFACHRQTFRSRERNNRHTNLPEWLGSCRPSTFCNLIEIRDIDKPCENG